MNLKTYLKTHNLTLKKVSEQTELSISLLSKISNNQIAISKETEKILRNRLGYSFTNDIDAPKTMASKYKKEIEELTSNNKKLTLKIEQLQEVISIEKNQIKAIKEILEETHYTVPYNKQKEKENES